MSDCLPWLRLYVETMTDPKVEFLSFEDQRHFVWLLMIKRKGYLDENYPSEKHKLTMLSNRLGLQGETLLNAKERLIEVGLIDDDWQPISWDKLQMQSDTSKERTRRYRARMNAKRNQALSGGERHCDVTVTAQEKDIDIKKHSNEVRVVNNSVDNYIPGRRNYQIGEQTVYLPPPTAANDVVIARIAARWHVKITGMDRVKAHKKIAIHLDKCGRAAE